MQTALTMPGAHRPCEVLHFVSTFAPKTDTNWLLGLARYLDRRAFRLNIACFYDGGPLKEQFEALGARTFNLDVPREHDPRAILRARELIERIDAQIVHTHLLRADLHAGLAARWAAAPVIISTAYAIGEYRREKRRRSDRLLDAVCSALPMHTIAVAQAVAWDCVHRLHMDSKDITVIHTGVEPPEDALDGAAAAFRRQWRCENRPLVVTVARLTYEKGVDVLVEAAAAVHRRNPEAVFMVLGDGPLRPALEGRIAELGLGDVVRLVGFQPSVWPALAAADVVCMPSHSEGMPNALLEAMAVGRAVVATRVGGIPEAIVDEVNGLLVEPGRPDFLAERVLRCLGEPILAARLAATARQTVTERFLARGAAERYAALYQRLLDQRRPGHGTLAVAG